MRRAERDIFGALDGAVRDSPMRPNDWSPKDHQAHLTAWKARQARRFASAREGIEIPTVHDGDETDELNAEFQEARADWTWDAVTAEADQVSTQLENEIRETDPDLIAGSERLLAGTLGNGAFHAMTHFGWLVDADIGVRCGPGQRVRRRGRRADSRQPAAAERGEHVPSTTPLASGLFMDSWTRLASFFARHFSSTPNWRRLRSRMTI